MPDDVLALVPQDTVLELWYSAHAESQAYSKYKIRPNSLRKNIVVKRENIIEIAVTEQGSLEKFVARFPFSCQDDICMVIMPKGRAWLVKTVWLNSVSDHHRTLKTWLYVDNR